MSSIPCTGPTRLKSINNVVHLTCDVCDYVQVLFDVTPSDARRLEFTHTGQVQFCPVCVTSHLPPIHLDS